MLFHLIRVGDSAKVKAQIKARFVSQSHCLRSLSFEACVRKFCASSSGFRACDIGYETLDKVDLTPLTLILFWV